jgi:hypothetical protein
VSDRVLLRIEKVAARYNVCGRTISRAIDAGRLTKFTQGARVYVDAAEVDQWARNRAAITPHPRSRTLEAK